jgi:hypothetical protein
MRRGHSWDVVEAAQHTYTRRAKARVGRCSTPVYRSPSRIAPQGCMDEVKGRILAACCLDATVGVCLLG